MTPNTFIRSTHENGRFRPYPRKAYQFWSEHGWLVGEVLRQEQGMNFEEIMKACLELLQEHTQKAPIKINEKHIAWCLIKLIEFDMATIIRPTEQGTNKDMSICSKR